MLQQSREMLLAPKACDVTKTDDRMTPCYPKGKRCPRCSGMALSLVGDYGGSDSSSEESEEEEEEEERKEEQKHPAIKQVLVVGSNYADTNYYNLQQRLRFSCVQSTVATTVQWV